MHVYSDEIIYSRTHKLSYCLRVYMAIMCMDILLRRSQSLAAASLVPKPAHVHDANLLWSIMKMSFEPFNNLARTNMYML